jgi:hypothetical protein
MNYWAILVAAVTSFMLGGLWYSPALFGGIWNRENGGVPPPSHPARVFGISFLFSLLAAYIFALFVGPDAHWHTAVHKGLLVGAGLVATSFGINYQFAQRSFKLWLIDGGYHMVQFVLFGLVLGLWH